jgi:hypothetical protein
MSFLPGVRTALKKDPTAALWSFKMRAALVAALMVFGPRGLVVVRDLECRIDARRSAVYLDDLDSITLGHNTESRGSSLEQ